MATGSKSSKRTPPNQAVKTVAQLQQEWAGKPKPRRGKWLILAGVLAAGVYFLPWLVCHTPLKDWAIARATAQVQGMVSVGWASAGWFTSIEAGNIEVRDPQGSVVIALPHVAVGKSLFGLITNLGNLGRIQLDGLRVDLAVRPDGSNVEDLLSKLPANRNPPSNSSRSPALGLDLHNASITIHDAAGQQSQIDNLEAAIDLLAGALLPSSAEVSGVAAAGARPSPFHLKVTPAAATGNGGGSGDVQAVELRTDGLSLAAISPLLGRFVHDGRLAGYLTCNLSGQVAGITSDKPRAAIQGEVIANDIVLAGMFAPGEQLELKQVRTPLRVGFHDNRLDVEQFELTCDVGQLSARGSLPLSGKSQLEMLQSCLKESCSVNGQLDLARLAQRLPKTCKLRDDLQLTSGTISIAGDCRPVAGGHSWQASVQTSPLAAIAAGKQITWDNPITVNLAAHDVAGQGPTVDSLQCEASFLRAQAAGSLDQLGASAVCDLDRLTAELGRFVDLSDYRLTGSATAQLSWQRQDDNRGLAQGNVQMQNLQVHRPGKLPWSEKSLKLLFNADGTLDGTRLVQCNVLSLELQSDGEDARLDLSAPVNLARNTAWTFKTHVQGPLSKWAARLQGLVNLDGYAIDGAADLTAGIAYSTAGVEISDGQLSVNRLHLWGGGLFVDDPSLLVQTSGRWDTATNKLSLGKTLVNSTTINLETDDFTLALPDKGGPQMAGTIQLAGDAGRLYAWSNDPHQPAPLLLVGRLGGQARLTTQGAHVSATANAAIEQFAAYEGNAQQLVARGVQPQPIWQERKVELAADGAYDGGSNSAKVTVLELAADALHLRAGGAATKLSSTCDVDLNGQIDYDLAILSKVLKPYLGSAIELAGRESRKFSLRGPLSAVATTSSPAAAPASLAARLLPLTAQASLGWESATVYGLKVGKGDIDVSLGSRQLNVKPLDIPISEGRLTFAPQFEIAHEPAKMLLGKGPLISEVRITPEVCATGLKFIAPSLADSTRADGKFSLALAGGQIPLGAPTTSDVSGQLTVHSVQVLPGPTAKSMIGMARQLLALVRGTLTGDSEERAIMTMDTQNIEFRLVNGRVYHQNVTMQFGEVTIRTHGSVGLDETLDIVAEFPLKPEWTAKSPVLAGLSDQAISIPIHGTLAHPQVGPHILQQLSSKMFEGAARDAIQKNLGGVLDKLLKPK